MSKPEPVAAADSFGRDLFAVFTNLNGVHHDVVEVADVVIGFVVTVGGLAGCLRSGLSTGLGPALLSGSGLAIADAVVTVGQGSVFDSLVGCARGSALGARRRLLLLGGQYGLVGGFLLRGRRGHRKPF